MLAALLNSRFKELEFTSDSLCIKTQEQLHDAYQVMRNLTEEDQEAIS